MVGIRKDHTYLNVNVLNELIMIYSRHITRFLERPLLNSKIDHSDTIVFNSPKNLIEEYSASFRLVQLKQSIFINKGIGSFH